MNKEGEVARFLQPPSSLHLDAASETFLEFFVLQCEN